MSSDKKSTMVARYLVSGDDVELVEQDGCGRCDHTEFCRIWRQCVFFEWPKDVRK